MRLHSFHRRRESAQNFTSIIRCPGFHLPQTREIGRIDGKPHTVCNYTISAIVPKVQPILIVRKLKLISIHGPGSEFRQSILNAGLAEIFDLRTRSLECSFRSLEHGSCTLHETASNATSDGSLGYPIHQWLA